MCGVYVDMWDCMCGGGRERVVVDISDIAIISVIPDMVKGMISGITNTPQTTYRIAQ